MILFIIANIMKILLLSILVLICLSLNVTYLTLCKKIISDLMRCRFLNKRFAFLLVVYMNFLSFIILAHIILKAISKLSLLRLCDSLKIKIQRISFVICNDLIEEKNEFPPTNKSFILRKSNRHVEYWYFIYHN